MGRPCDHHRIVGEDDERNAHLEPAEPLAFRSQPTQGQRGCALVLMADRVVQEQDRQADKQQGNNVGNDEGTTTILVRKRQMLPSPIADPIAEMRNAV